MTLPERREERPPLPNPVTGELVDTRSLTDVCAAVQRADELTELLAEFRSILEGVLLTESEREGAKTLHVGGVASDVGIRPDWTVVIRGGPSSHWDAQDLAEALRAAGMPDARVDELVAPVVDYRVNRSKLKQAASANEAYAAAIESVRRVRPANYSVRVEKRR